MRATRVTCRGRDNPVERAIATPRQPSGVIETPRPLRSAHRIATSQAGFTEPVQTLLAREARGSLQRMNEGQIRAELEAVKAALSQPTADLADLQARVDSAASSLAVLVGHRRRP